MFTDPMFTDPMLKVKVTGAEIISLYQARAGEARRLVAKLEEEAIKLRKQLDESRGQLDERMEPYVGASVSPSHGGHRAHMHRMMPMPPPYGSPIEGIVQTLDAVKENIEGTKREYDYLTFMAAHVDATATYELPTIVIRALHGGMTHHMMHAPMFGAG